MDTATESIVLKLTRKFGDAYEKVVKVEYTRTCKILTSLNAMNMIICQMSKLRVLKRLLEKWSKTHNKDTEKLLKFSMLKVGM